MHESHAVTCCATGSFSSDWSEMVKSKDSMTSAQRAMLAHVNQYIAETQPKIDAVIETVKKGLLEDYTTEYETEEQAARVRAAVANYEPMITEEEINDIIYGGTNYAEVIYYLENALDGTDWVTADDFYIAWSALRNMTEQRKRIIAGQLVMMQ